VTLKIILLSEIFLTPISRKM